MNSEEKILNRSDQYQMPFEKSNEEALLQIKSKIATGIKIEAPVKRFKNANLYRNLAIAASLAILIGLWILWVNKPIVHVIADKGQHSQYNLPDGSEVVINADSKITFNKKNFHKKRCLSLEGEAFFNVKKGKSFIINTKLADIKVLGTSFNVYARESAFKVSCLTGKIMVSSGKQKLIIIPGESAVVSDNNLVKYIDAKIDVKARWRDGEFYFENDSLSLIFKEVERQYNVTFTLPNITNKYFTGSFSNKNMVEALDIVCIPMGLTYEIGSNSKIFIHEKMQ